MAQSSKLLNFHESYVIAGFPMTKIYTELNTNIKVGDKVFIVGGNYDTYMLGMGIGNPYAQYADGYEVLVADDKNNFVVIDYPFDVNKDIYSPLVINGCKDEAYLSTGYFRGGEFNGGNFNDGIIGQKKFVETTDLFFTEFLNIGPDNYIVVDQGDYFILNNTGEGKIYAHDKLLVQNARDSGANDFDGIYTIEQIVPPNTLGITNFAQYAFKVTETVNTFSFPGGVELQRTNSVAFSNGVASPKINHAIWQGGVFIKGNFESKTDNYVGYNFKKAEVDGNIVNVQDLSGLTTNNSGLGYNHWLSGLFTIGDWKNGTWHQGVWQNGDFRKGQFNGGLWFNGTKHTGIFSSINSYVRWFNGTHTTGTMEDVFWENGAFLNGDWYGAKNYKITNIDRVTVGLNQWLRIHVDPKIAKRFANTLGVLVSYVKSNGSFNNEAIDNPNMKRATVSYTDSVNGYIVLKSKQYLTLPPNLDFTNAVISNSYFRAGDITNINWKSGLLCSGYAINNFDDTVAGSLSFECLLDSDERLSDELTISVGDTVYLANYQYFDGTNYIDLADVPLTVTNVSSQYFSAPPVIVTVSITPLAQNNTSFISLINLPFVNKSRWLNGNFYSGNMLYTNFRQGNVYAQLETQSDKYLTVWESGWWTRIPSTSIGPNVTWHNGIWLEGVFGNGDWLDGVFHGPFQATYVDQPISPQLQYSARWYNGTITGNGEWYFGEFLNGVIANCFWHNGILPRQQTPFYIQRSSVAINHSSTTENYISGGSKTFIVEPGLDYASGQTISITTPGGKQMSGTITSYVHNNLKINVTSLGLSGTVGVFTNWTLTQYQKCLDFSGVPAYYWRIGMNFTLSGTLIGDDGSYTVRDIQNISGDTRIITTVNYGGGPLPSASAGNTVNMSYSTPSVNIFQNGIWEGGVWQNGNFNDGNFSGGVWQNGNFNNGLFDEGFWQNGKFNGGTMDGSANYVFWINGTINGGLIDTVAMLNVIVNDGTLENATISTGYFDGGNLNNSFIGGDGTVGTGNSFEFNGGVANNTTCDGGVINGGTFNGGYFLGSVPFTPSVMTDGYMNGTVLNGLGSSCYVIGGIMENVSAFDQSVIQRGEFRSGTFDYAVGGSPGTFGGLNGAFTDFTNFDSLFQDQSSGGTAFYLAKTGNQVFTNGNFTTPTPSLTGWTALGGGTWAAFSDGARWSFPNNTTSELVVTTPPLTIGINYMVSIKIVSNTHPLNILGGVSVRIIAGPTIVAGNNFLLEQTSPGIYSGPVLANGTNFRIQVITNLFFPAAGDIIIDDVVCKPINNSLPLAPWLQVSPMPAINYTNAPGAVGSTTPYVWCSNINVDGSSLNTRCRLIGINPGINNGWVKIFHSNTFGLITKKYPAYDKFPISASVWNDGNFNGGTFSSIWRSGITKPITGDVTFNNAVWEGGTCGSPINSAEILVNGTEILVDGSLAGGMIPAGWNFSNITISNLFGTYYANSNNVGGTSTTFLWIPLNSQVNAGLAGGANVNPTILVSPTGLPFKLGSVVRIVSNTSPEIWMRAVIRSYTFGSNLAVTIIEKNGSGNVDNGNNWSIIPEEIVRQTAAMAQNPLAVGYTPLSSGKYYRVVSNGFLAADSRDFFKIKMGTEEYLLHGIPNTSNQIVPKTFFLKANGAVFSMEMIHDYIGFSTITPVSVQEIKVPFMQNTDWISGTANTVDFNSTLAAKSTFVSGTIDNSLLTNMFVKSGTFNQTKMKDCNVSSVIINDGHFTATTNSSATLNGSTINNLVFERGQLNTCNNFYAGLLLGGQVNNGSFGSTYGQFAVGEVTWSQGSVQSPSKGYLQLFNITAFPGDVAGSTLVIHKNLSPFLTLTASVNYAPYSYPAIGYNPANWQANQPAAIVSTVRTAANWGADNWAVILRDVLEFYLESTGPASPFLVQFGEIRNNFANSNYGEATSEGLLTSGLYITHVSPPIGGGSLYYGKDPSSTTTISAANAAGIQGNLIGKINNDKWADVVTNVPTSLTSHTMTTGSKIFTGVDDAANYSNVQNKRVIAKISRLSNPATFMVGRVTAYAGNILTVDVLYVSVAGGPFNDWFIQLYYPPQTGSTCAVLVVVPGDGGGGGFL